eukprot:1164335-Prymnesium_polylepis.1
MAKHGVRSDGVPVSVDLGFIAAATVPSRWSAPGFVMVDAATGRAAVDTTAAAAVALPLPRLRRAYRGS